MLVRLKLGWQIFVALTILAVAIGAASGLITREIESDYLFKQVREQADEKLTFLASSSLDNIISEDVPQLETTARQIIAKDPAVAILSIRNENDKILYSWRRNPLPPVSNRQHFSRAITFSDEYFGRISIDWDVSDIVASYDRHALFIGFAVGLACLILGVCVLAVVNLLVVRPIDRVAERAKNFRAGRFDNATPAGRIFSAEIERLYQSVNELGRFLESREAREIELQHAKDLAETASRAKSNFLANMSHELRTPLNAILGFAQVMENEMLGSLGHPKYREYIQDMRMSGEHLLSIISEVLDMSKIEVGKLELNFEDCDINRIIAESITFVRGIAAEKNIELRVEVPMESPRVYGDVVRLKQVVVNILSNALKYTQEKGRVEVTVSCPSTATELEIQVRDNGRGIQDRDIARIMMPFERVDDSMTSSSAPGTGLGLPLANSLVRLHKGTLELNSEFGKGTVVTVLLPSQGVCNRDGYADAAHFTERKSA